MELDNCEIATANYQTMRERSLLTEGFTFYIFLANEFLHSAGQSAQLVNSLKNSLNNSWREKTFVADFQAGH